MHGNSVVMKGNDMFSREMARAIYSLRRLDKVHHDELRAVIVIADNSTQARRLAAHVCGDESAEIWLGFDYVNAEIIAFDPLLPNGIICRDFLHG